MNTAISTYNPSHPPNVVWWAPRAVPPDGTDSERPSVQAREEGERGDRGPKHQNTTEEETRAREEKWRSTATPREK